MNSWKDAICAAAGLALLAFGQYYAFVVIEPSINSRSIYPPGTLFPSCDYFPNGVNGKPCVDSDVFAKTGKLVFRGQ